MQPLVRASEGRGSDKELSMAYASTSIRDRRTSRRPYVFLLAMLIVLGATAVLVLVGQDRSGSSTEQGSGTPVTQERDLPSFAAVDLAGTNSVRVTVGPEQSVAVRADDNLLDHVTTDVSNGRLTIGELGSFTASTPMSVDITVPNLERVALTGTGSVAVEGVRADDFAVELQGTGSILAVGAARRLHAKLDGDGDGQLQDLAARDVIATVSGTGRLRVHATGSLEASVPGTGSIVYSGNPTKVTESVTGTGTIVEGG
jgi:Putative auto-transporter adhesin, head GIN domain